MEYHKPTQSKIHNRNACALLALFLWAIPSLASAQLNTLTVSPQPSEGLITFGSIVNGAFSTSVKCGVFGNGTTSTTCSFSDSAGSDVRLLAVAGPAYQFLGWSGDAGCSGTTAMITFTNNRNRTCTPHFIHAAYTQVATSAHQCALTTNGGVQCWGVGSNGRLGNGKDNDSLIPVTAQGISTAIAVTVGSDHSCALLMDKTMQCWGDNDNGQLGIGTKGGTFNTPQTVVALSNVIAIDVGSRHTCAIREGGSVLCWGDSNARQLGLGTIGQISVPTTLSNITNAVAISAGSEHTCAVLSTGGAKCWGFSTVGALGTDTGSVRISMPRDVLNLSEAVAISASANHTCALLNNGRAKCWGLNSSGQLGTGDTNNSNTPVDVKNLSTAITISVGNKHTCALLNNGRVQCWGSNEFGQLGLGFNVSSSTVPVIVPSITTAISASAGAGSFTTCAILTDGNAYCWGSQYAAVPTPVPGQPGVFIPSATINAYKDSPFIAVSPYRTIPATVVTNSPSWLTYFASTGAFFGIPASAASGITITAGSNPPFPVSPVKFSITIQDLPTVTSLIIEDTDAARANNIPIDAAVNAQLINPQFIAKGRSDSKTQIPVRWSLAHTAGLFSINANTGILTLTAAVTEQGYTINVQADFPTLEATALQPNLPTATSTKNFVINGVAVGNPLRLHLKTFLEGPLQ